jgi:hypothetical protein
MANLTKKQQQKLLAGSLIGAILGAGVAYLLASNPPPRPEGEEPLPITGTDLISLTAAISILIRKFDDLRRRI